MNDKKNQRRTAYKRIKRNERLLFAAVFIIEWAFGVYLGYNGVLLGDAMSRTANAFYVFYSEPYNLTSMGFVWNPLPSLLQLPFVLLSKLWRPFVTKGIAMSFASALFAAWGAKGLYQTFHLMKVKEKYALPVVLLYCFNPYIFFYGANGMTELMMASCGIQIICSLTLWMKKGHASEMITMAFCFALMFLIRYEAIPFAIFIALGMALHMMCSRRERRYFPEKGLEKLWYVEGSMWVTFLPIIYAVVVWILYNWSITGNPFYFLNSGYSMSAYSAYYTSYGGLFDVISYVFSRTWPFLIMPACVLISLFLSHRVKKHDTVIMILAMFGLMFFTTIMIVLGKSGGYVRYLCYPLMFSVAFLPYIYAKAGPYLKRVACVALAGLVLTGGVFIWAFQYSDTFREDLLLNIPAQTTQLSDYINHHLRGRRILMDSYRTYYAIMNVDVPEDLVISCSMDFEDCVADPVGTGIEYVVVPQIGSYGNMDALNIAYPELYYKGAPWAQLEAELGEFKLYKVIR